MSRRDISFYVKELKIIQTGEFNDIFLRPYTTQVSGRVTEVIEENLAKTRNRFTPSILSKIANQFIVPDSNPRGLIEIPGGWSVRRGRFYMIVEIELPMGDRIMQMLIGYTSSESFTTRNIDPYTEFIVNNSFTMVEKRIRNDRGGFDRVYVPNNPKDVISDRESAGLRRRGPKLYTMRPEDIFSSIDAENLSDMIEDMTDLRTVLSKNAQTSSSRNRLSGSYMSRVMDSRRKAAENNNDFANSAADINASAQGYVSEEAISNDYFLRHISNMRGLKHTSDTFEYRDLLEMDDTIDRRAEPFLLDSDALSKTRFRDESEKLDGREEEDRVAAIVGIAIPALMMECGLASVKFQAHNDDLLDPYTFLPGKSYPFMEDVDATPFIERFEDRLIDELMVPLTGGDRRMYSMAMQVSCQVFGNIDLSLHWDGNYVGRFVFPAFSNSLYSPILTDSIDDLTTAARNFSDLFEHFDDTAGEAKLDNLKFSY